MSGRERCYAAMLRFRLLLAYDSCCLYATSICCDENSPCDLPLYAAKLVPARNVARAVDGHLDSRKQQRTDDMCALG